MPSSIPYDPSLVLTSVVSEQALKVVQDISTAQAPVDAAQDSLNSLISSKRSLDMTKMELANLGVDTAALDTELEKLKASIGGAAASYAAARVAAEPQIQKLREQIRTVHAAVESPVDYVKSEIKTMPLAADSMNMDVQYFTFDNNSQNASTFASAISTYVGESASFLGRDAASKLSDAAQTQVSRQVESHKIEGTLVLSVSCTHKNASVLAPFVLHVDKAIQVWNHLFPGKKLDPTSRGQMAQIAMTDDNNTERFSIISGTTFGSSFVGMVHVLNQSDTKVSESLSSMASSLQAQMDAGAWFAKAEGKYGVNSSFGSDVKNMLSSQNVTSHVTLLSMGVIPSMVANDVDSTVKEFADFDPKKNMEAVATIQNATMADQSSVKSMAESARTGEQAADLRGKDIAATLSSVSVIQAEKNKILNINSMMTALDDYLKKATEGSSGVPINYYLKDIDIKMLAEMWVAKYFPGDFMAIKYDDTEGAGPAATDASGAPKAKL